MAFDSFASFVQMGQHGVYVWTSFGLAWACFVGLAIDNRVRRKQALKKIIQQMRRENG
jgi:heme exporter protein D